MPGDPAVPGRKGFFVRSSFGAQLPNKHDTAGSLLEWATTVADAADPGAVYRAKEGRRTLRFQLGESGYFLKLHDGIGWREWCKNRLQGRTPVTGARDEYLALRALSRAGVDTLSIAAFATTGYNPAKRRSMIVTDELRNTESLEDACARWPDSPPSFALRLAIILQLATIARTMHSAGINHRDFYLCHFHLDTLAANAGEVRLHLIDLHRAQLRDQVPYRWRVKDLAALYFSALDCGVTRRDVLRFIQHYSGTDLRLALRSHRSLWRAVERRALRMQARGVRG